MAERMAPAWRSVTLRQLLMHRAGVAPFTSPDEFETVPQAVRRGEPMAQRLAFTTWMLHQPMPGAAGAFEYSNAGYGLAAAMVERVTGRSWDTMLQERLLDRLGIAASEVRVGWPGLRGAAPWGHVDDGRAWTPHSPTDDRIVAIPAALAPAGDLAMTMSAYGRFLQLHVQGLAGTDGAVKAATIRALHEPDGEYALGWGVQGPPGRTMHFHEGSVGTFHVVALLDPRRGVAVATVTNAGGEDAADRIRTAALKSLP
jgi:CubicO group peptidase (beta-lactamase class C family)